MGTKSFEIEWKDGTETIEFDDDITFGKREDIVNKCVNMENPTQPKVNLPLFRQMIVTATITKAPFPLGDINVLRSMKSSVVDKIVREVTTVYPLEILLGRWMESLTGLGVEELTERYSTSLQENLDGTGNR